MTRFERAVLYGISSSQGAAAVFFANNGHPWLGLLLLTSSIVVFIERF